MIRSMERYTFASALDLNMGYYHIKLHQITTNVILNTDAQKLCTILFPWQMGKYKYKRLPVGGYQDCLVPDFFQNVMSKLVQDMECVKTIMLS
jgi:hypothetical protein